MTPILTTTRPLTQKDLAENVQYACGRNIFPGWLNVDGFDISYPNGAPADELTKQIFQMDLTQRHPFPDNYFRYGYSEDFIEHLTQATSLVFLTECFRTFAENGVLRLSFPGLRGVLKRHFRGTNFETATTGVQEAYTMWNHEHFYSEESIDLVARYIGFSKVRFCQFGVSEHEALQNRESRPDQRDLNIVVELTK